MMKKELPEGTGTDGKIPLGKEEREDLLASVMNGLKEESDEVLKSVAQVVQDLKQNAGMREALETFYKNGWPLIQKTGKSENEIKLGGPTLSSTFALDMDKPKKSASRLDHEMHPMRNELVLKKVFAYSSVESLKNCRLVSKEWRDLSLNSWREKAVLCVNTVVDDDGDAEDFIQDGSEFQEIPFKKYKLFYTPHNFRFEVKKTFLNTFASSIQSMYLSSRDLKTMFSLLTKLPELRVASLEFDVEDFSMEYETLMSDPDGGKCPFRRMQRATSKLRELELKISLMDYCGWEAVLRFPWEKVFRRVPSIESLRVEYKPEKGCTYRKNDLHLTTFEDIIRSLCEVRKKGNLSTLNLKELDILDTQQHPLMRSNRLTVDIATSIIESHLPLRTLGIHLGNIDSNQYQFTISNLLEAHANTLQYMKCNSHTNTKYEKKEVLKLPIPPYLPEKVLLPNLTELVFVTGCIWAFHVLGSLDVPNLETLRIEPNKSLIKKETDRQLDLKPIVSASKSLKTFYGASFLPNLKKFFYNGPRRFTWTELRGLGNAMPNVTDLGIPFCDTGAFWIVYELWPGLESLHVLVSERTYLLFDDYVITGLPIAGENDDDDDAGAGAGVRPMKSNITNLKDLRKFVLEAKVGENFPWPRRALITDCSAVYG